MKAEYKEGPKARENFERRPRQKIYVSALFTLGCFAHDPQSVLTAVRAFALVRVKLLLDLGLCLRLSAFPGLMNGEPRIAEPAHSQHWDVLAALDDPKSPLCRSEEHT